MKHQQVTSIPKTFRKLAWNFLTVFCLNFEKNPRFFFIRSKPYSWDQKSESDSLRYRNNESKLEKKNSSFASRTSASLGVIRSPAYSTTNSPWKNFLVENIPRPLSGTSRISNLGFSWNQFLTIFDTVMTRAWTLQDKREPSIFLKSFRRVH